MSLIENIEIYNKRIQEKNRFLNALDRALSQVIKKPNYLKMMDDFVDTLQEKTVFLSPQTHNFSKGDQVKVIEGRLQGWSGKVEKVFFDSLNLEGICYGVKLSEARKIIDLHKTFDNQHYMHLL